MEAGVLFLGVSYAHTVWYVKGTPDERALLIEKYRRLYYILTKYNIPVFKDRGFAPEELNLDEDPNIWYSRHVDPDDKIGDLLG